MKASAIEYRLRVVIILAVVALGFWAPWIVIWGPWLGIARRISLLGWLAQELSRSGLLPFPLAVRAVIAVAVLLAAKGVVLRIWGTAYLGAFTVNHARMKAGAVLADGPYRFVRNPLYLGTWCMVAAMAFVMPASGALFTMVLLTLFQVRLILAEEAFLTVQLNGAYRAYLHTVPRLLPHLRTPMPSTGQEPRWGQAVLAEINPIGVFLILACLSWKFDNELMVRAILVSFGVSLVVRALFVGNATEGAN
jgi:protein-S-isoprenylcysteine O-methyltransferase Ste14